MSKENFKGAKIYTANNQINKVWFVYYYFNVDGKYKRFKVYEDADHNLTNGNKIKILKNKIDYFNRLATIINNKLSNGWNPLGLTLPSNSEFMCIDIAISNVLKYKQNSMTDESFKSYQSRISIFKDWLINKGLSFKDVRELEKKHISEFLFNRQISFNISNRTINNYLVDIKAMFNVMVNLGYITINPSLSITKINTRSTQHALYTESELQKISAYMIEHEPYLLLYCRFIWLGFRPLEICKLKVGNVFLDDNKILIEGRNEKNGKSLYKNILSKYKEHIEGMNLEQYPKHYYLFSAKKEPSATGTTRDYFTKKFQKVKKALNFPREYTMYGFRHTMCVELLKNGESVKNIMAITGHTQLDSFQCYIQKYLNEPGQDVSHRFKFLL